MPGPPCPHPPLSSLSPTLCDPWMTLERCWSIPENPRKATSWQRRMSENPETSQRIGRESSRIPDNNPLQSRKNLQQKHKRIPKESRKNPKRIPKESRKNPKNLKAFQRIQKNPERLPKESTRIPNESRKNPKRIPKESRKNPERIPNESRKNPK